MTAEAEQILEKSIIIRNKRGLHARASAKFVTVASQFDARVQVCKDGQCIGGTSIMGLMMLGAAPGDEISILTSGAQAQDALDALSALVDAKFNED
jgi:phosphocarrier protein HPr